MSEKIDVGAYAEGFKMRYARILLTAATQELADTAARAATGYGTSIIGCSAEAGMEGPTVSGPDGRPGRLIQIWHTSKKKLEDELLHRLGQCAMTAPTVSIFNALEGDPELVVDTGKKLAFFGDKHQKKATVQGHNVSVIPVMDGEVFIELEFGIRSGVAGGNLVILGRDLIGTLEATQRSVRAIHEVSGVVMTFPGGICRSGSKVGSQYKFLSVSTNHRFCPTLRDTVVDSLLPPEAQVVYEIVLNGVDEKTVSKAMKAGANRAAEHSSILRVTAANYGGSLGTFHLQLA